MILQPYERRKPPGPFRRFLAGMGLVFLAAFYGLMCTVLPMQLIIVPLFPIVVLAALTLWMLPDIGGVHYDSIAKGMVWYIGFATLWPSYVALNAPGLPIITPTRIALFTTLLMIAFNFATSREMRSQVIASTNSIPAIPRAYWLFWLTTVVSLPFSDILFASLTKFMNNQLYWTIPFAISAWLASREGFTMRVCRTITVTVLLVALMALPEWRTQTPIWIPQLPSFLRIDPDLLAQLSETNARNGTIDYRLRGIFAGALYFAEYLAILLPFVLHFWVRQRTLWGFVLLALGLVLMAVVMFLTGSRSAMLALVLTPLSYTFLTAWRLRIQKPESIGASVTIYGFPVAAMAVVMLVIFWRRLHVLIIGGGQHSNSSMARGTQWSMGWPKIFERPLGHGAGRSGETLGYYNPGKDNPTVDTYYLTLLLDYGFLGLLFFFALFALVIWHGFKLHNQARTEEQLLMGPIIASLLNFIIIKSVASTEANIPLMMIFIGCVLGLASRQAQIDAADSARGVVPIAPKLRPHSGRVPAFA
jgi:hypothetical protein